MQCSWHIIKSKTVLAIVCASCRNSINVHFLHPRSNTPIGEPFSYLYATVTWSQAGVVTLWSPNEPTFICSTWILGNKPGKPDQMRGADRWNIIPRLAHTSFWQGVMKKSNTMAGKEGHLIDKRSSRGSNCRTLTWGEVMTVSVHHSSQNEVTSL